MSLFRKTRTKGQESKSRDPYIEIEQLDVNEFRWMLLDPVNGLAGLGWWVNSGIAASFDKARANATAALERHLARSAVAGRKWTLTMEEVR